MPSDGAGWSCRVFCSVHRVCSPEVPPCLLPGSSDRGRRSIVELGTRRDRVEAEHMMFRVCCLRSLRPPGWATLWLPGPLDRHARRRRHAMVERSPAPRPIVVPLSPPRIRRRLDRAVFSKPADTITRGADSFFLRTRRKRLVPFAARPGGGTWKPPARRCRGPCSPVRRASGLVHGETGKGGGGWRRNVGLVDGGRELAVGDVGALACLSQPQPRCTTLRCCRPKTYRAEGASRRRNGMPARDAARPG
jgi:hypothetical protein